MKKGDKVKYIDDYKVDKVRYLRDNTRLTKGIVYWVHKNNFEPIKEQTMKKKDLKNGMVVEYSIGLDDDKFAMVLNDRLISLNGFMPLKKYNEDLLCEVNNVFDIIAVYEVDGYGNGLIDILNGKSLKKLWQRE
jgi:hypothetical protein